MGVGSASRNTKVLNIRFLLYRRSVAAAITRFFMYAPERTPSAQKLLDTPACRIIDNAASWRACSFAKYKTKLRRDEYLFL